MDRAAGDFRPALLPHVSDKLLRVLDALARRLFSVVWGAITVHVAFAHKCSLASLVKDICQDLGAFEVQCTVPTQP
jgi:hypothetical protein